METKRILHLYSFHKIEKAQDDLNFLENQIDDFLDSRDKVGDWVDSASNGNEIDMLYLEKNENMGHQFDDFELRDMETLKRDFKEKF